MVTYPQACGRGLQGAGGPHPSRAARPALRAGRADAERPGAAVADVPLRRDEAPEGARGGWPGDDPEARSREAALSQPRPDPAHPRPLGEQVHGALGLGAQRAEERDGGGVMNDEQAYTVVGGRGSMTVFEIYIKTTPERLWEAITSEQMRKRYSFGVGTSSEWTQGSEYKSSVPGVIDIASGENLEVEPPRRLVQSFTALWSEEVQKEGASRVTWEIEPVGSSCRLRVTHDQLGEAANNELYGGWPMILSGLKTLLETGEDLDTPGSLRYSG